MTRVENGEEGGHGPAHLSHHWHHFVRPRAWTPLLTDAPAREVVGESGDQMGWTLVAFPDPETRVQGRSS